MTVSNTLAERGARYGQFADHARIAQGIQDVMRIAPNWDKLDLDMKQALTTIADKIARILNGDPFYLDNWHDIQGYAKLIEDRLNMIEESDDSLYETQPIEHSSIPSLVKQSTINEALKKWLDSEKRLQCTGRYVTIPDTNAGEHTYVLNR